MDRAGTKQWLLVCAVVCGAGCGAHRGAQRPAAVGFESVTHVQPEGTLSGVQSPPATRRPAPPPPASEAVPSAARSVVEAARAAAAPATPKPAASEPVAARPDSTAPASEPPAAPPVSSAALSETPAEVVTRVDPVYPKGAEVWGIVLVSAYVDTLGNVTQTRIERSIRELDTAALAAVRKYRFKPATRGGQPSAGWVSVPVKFMRH